MTMYLTEFDLESAALAWLEGLGWRVKHGADIAPRTPAAEREDFAIWWLQARNAEQFLEERGLWWKSR